MNRDNYGQSRHAGSDEKPLEQLWPGYLRGGYFDAQGALVSELVLRERMEPLARSMAQCRNPLTANQIRRFFGHCRSIEADLRAHRDDWSVLYPKLLKLDVFASDAFGKEPPKIPCLFYDFIRLNIAAVASERDFLHGYLPHFEALVGFGSGYFRTDRS